MSKSETILTVSIGGSVKGVPMSDTRWGNYIMACRDCISATVGFPDFEQRGESTWKGISERSYTFNVLGPMLGADPYTNSRLAQLKKALAQLCHHMGQDAIALTLGDSELIEPHIEGE